MIGLLGSTAVEEVEAAAAALPLSAASRRTRPRNKIMIN